MANEVQLVGGCVLNEGAFEETSISVDGDLIAGAPPSRAPVIDISGYMVVPGIVDMHGDAFERHLAPRPRAPFPMQMGLAGTDRDAAVNGVTTAWMAQSWSWEAGMRHPDFAEAFLTAVRDYKPRALVDLRVQLRCETHTMDSFDRLLAAVATYDVDYVVFNDHLPEALEILENNPQDFAAWGARSGSSFEQHRDRVQRAKARDALVPDYIAGLSEYFAANSVRYGSHDDPDVATRKRYAALGASVCEFPTARAPAQAARGAGDCVVMGAPNVVRGGSQSGNISAEPLIAEGLCDVLVSDYHYPALPQAAFTLADNGVMSLAEAWALISSNPARRMGLADRGTLAEGQRADLVVINSETRAIEGTMSAGRWAHLCGELAARLSAARSALVRAAE